MKGGNGMDIGGLLRTSPIFRSLSDEDLPEALQLLSVSQTAYSRGETIARAGERVTALTFIAAGTATVFRDSEQRVLINVLGVGDCFGAANLFAERALHPTEIVAKTEVLCISASEESLRSLFLRFPTSALDYISFLSDRIRFLNRRIRDFSCGSAEEKVASLLLSSLDDDGLATIPNLRAAAESMNVGRASLYRVLAVLSDRGLIEKNGKQIHILNFTELKGILSS